MYVLVLSDGTTWGSLAGSRILEMPSCIFPENQDEWIKNNFVDGTDLSVTSYAAHNGDILIDDYEEYDDEDYDEYDEEYDELSGESEELIP